MQNLSYFLDKSVSSTSLKTMPYHKFILRRFVFPSLSLIAVSGLWTVISGYSIILYDTVPHLRPTPVSGVGRGSGWERGVGEEEGEGRAGLSGLY